MNWKQKLEAALKAAREIAVKAQSQGREHLTASEMQAFDAEMAKADEARAKIKLIEESDARFKALGELDPDLHPRYGGEAKAGDVLSFKGLGRRLKASMREDDHLFNVKSLIAAGSTVTTAQTLTSPVAMEKPATGLLDLLPVRIIEGDRYTYLQQTKRDNKAAPVAAGGTKPTSEYTLTRVDGKLQIIAHLSEAIPEQWLSDEPALGQFLETEMAYGIQVAVEDQVLNGDGDEPNLLGLLEVSGIQSQAFNTSKIRTVRSAITKVEALGFTASGLVLHPLDWEDIETAADGEDRFFMTPEGSPIDRARRRLWGVPVALSLAVEQESAVLVSDGSASIVTNRRLDFQMGRVGDDFSKNQVRARVEGRFGVETYRPTGIVAIDLAEEEEEPIGG